MKINYEYIGAKEFGDFFTKARPLIFKGDFDFNVRAVMAAKERQKIVDNSKLLQQVKAYFLVAKHKGEIVGWSTGNQRSSFDLYMANSAVYPEYRKQGIYNTMLQMTVDWAVENGFQRINSMHKMDNNAVLIPKLKFGFVISGFEINDIYGSLVTLSYYTNEKRRELLKVRIGSRKPDEETLKLIPK